MLGIDDIDLDPAAKRPHGDRRQKVGLSRARVAEHADVGIGIAALIEWVDNHRGSSRTVTTNHHPAWLLEICVGPREEGDKGARVEDALAIETVDSCGQGGQVCVEHPERARLDFAKQRTCRGLDFVRARLQALLRRRSQGEIQRDVERLLLAAGKPALEILSIGQRPRE